MTNEQRQRYITALLEERRGYDARGNADGVAQVDAELRRVGHEGTAPVTRAERRPSARTRKAEKR